jgi:hypothetical protein
VDELGHHRLRLSPLATGHPIRRDTFPHDLDPKQSLRPSASGARAGRLLAPQEAGLAGYLAASVLQS